MKAEFTPGIVPSENNCPSIALSSSIISNGRFDVLYPDPSYVKLESHLENVQSNIR